MLRTAWLVGVLGLAVACGSTVPVVPVVSTAPAVPLTATRGAGVRMVWRNVGLHPTGQPEAIGGLAVGIVADRGEAWVVGLDPATGVKRWQQPVTAGATVPWDAIRIAKVGDDRFAYLRPTRPGDEYAYAELVVADARTGDDVVKSPDALFASMPMLCAHDTAICAFTEDWNADRREQVQLELATGRFTVLNRHIPLRAYALAHFDAELLDLADYPDGSIGLLRDGRLQWFRRVSDLTARRFSLRYGSAWRHDADAHVIAGSIWRSVWDHGRWVRDLAQDTATVGLREDTGLASWRDFGTFLGCIGDRRYAVRCRARGVVRSRPGAPYVFEGLQVTVEGYDPATGTTTWTVPFGAAETLAPSDRSPPYAGETRRVIAVGNELTVLDYATGTTQPAAPGAAFWCMAEARHAFPIRLWGGGERWGEPTRPGGVLAFLCDGHGAPASALPDAAATFAIGARFGDRVVLATREAFLGFTRATAPDGPPAAPSPAR